jgi:hypothetical protein
LFGSASVAYYNKLGGRFLLPLYFPVVTVTLIAVAGLLRAVEDSGMLIVRRSISICLMGGLAIVGALLLQNTIPVVMGSHANGAAGGEDVFNTTAWHENRAQLLAESSAARQLCAGQ